MSDDLRLSLILTHRVAPRLISTVELIRYQYIRNWQYVAILIYQKHYSSPLLPRRYRSWMSHDFHCFHCLKHSHSQCSISDEPLLWHSVAVWTKLRPAISSVVVHSICPKFDHEKEHAIRASLLSFVGQSAVASFAPMKLMIDSYSLRRCRRRPSA